MNGDQTLLGAFAHAKLLASLRPGCDVYVYEMWHERRFLATTCDSFANADRIATFLATCPTPSQAIE